MFMVMRVTLVSPLPIADKLIIWMIFMFPQNIRPHLYAFVQRKHFPTYFLRS